MTRHRQSVWRSDIEFLSFVVGFFVTLLAIPPYLFAQGMLLIVPAEDYEKSGPWSNACPGRGAFYSIR